LEADLEKFLEGTLGTKPKGNMWIWDNNDYNLYWINPLSILIVLYL
jgi:hypothetical protein